VAVIEVYMDESGTHGDSQVVTVSSVWACPDQWKLWTYEWCIAKHPVRIYHASDCHNFKGEFQGWDRSFRDRYVLRMLEIVRRHHGIRGRIAGLDKHALTKALKKRPEVAAWIDNPYYTCFQWALERAWKILETDGHREIAFVHEANQYVTVAQEVFGYSKKRFMKSDATLDFGPKERAVPLQCADILAYEGNRQMRNFDAGLRKPLAALDPSGTRFAFVKFDRSEVGAFAEHLTRGFDEAS
jgi:hypothetical protein